MKSFNEVSMLRAVVGLMSIVIIISFAQDLRSQAPDVPAATAPQAIATVSQEAAEQKAVESMPGAIVERTSLVERQGRLAYQVEVDSQGKDVEVLVDANDGAILRTEYHIVMYARLDTNNEVNPSERY